MFFPAELANEVYRSSNLTQHQLLIWLGQKLMPDVPLFNATLAFTISGKIDAERFRSAFRRLVAASDTLRTVVEEIDGVPQQRVTEDLFYDLEYLDWSNLADAERLCREKLHERCRLPFDFSRRLFDAALIKIRGEKYVWYLNQHHIISDGTSFLLVYRYMAELYARTGTADFNLELPQLRDYVAEELEQQRSAAYANAAAYWQEKLAEPGEPFEPYGIRNRRTPRVERFSTTMGVERTAKLKALAAREDICQASGHAAIFSLLAAALYVYMYRTGASRTISIGVPFHNRASTAFREVLGLVMKVIPVRITVENGDSFLSVIAKIQREMTEIRPYRNIALPNSPGARAYDVWLNYITAVYPGFCGLPVHVEWLHPGHERDAMALQVYDFDGAGNFVLDFDCHRAVFDADEQRDVMRHYMMILDALLENPAARIDDILLIDDSERRLLVEDWNASTWRPSGEQTLPRLFEAAARRNPDGIALDFEGRATTYAQLNSAANRLARHLRALGAGPETIIALCAEPSPEMLVGILGILKAGAAYLPLDPEYPRERLSYMLADSGASLLLTEKRLSAVYPNLEGLNAPAAVYMDADREAIAAWPETDLEDGPGPQSLAYVMYTSGSTGAP
ncbi:MAG TPA: condensation domain-containing protein, partial [Candidatus Binatia bacterium]